jgi:hypothetical protein
MTMLADRPRTVSLALMLCAASLGGCGESSKDLSESSIYPSPSDQKRFRDALTSERVPHKVHIREDGKEEIRWNPQYSDRVEAIDKRLFGTAPTMGRNVALDSAEMQRFESALRDRGIPYEKRPITVASSCPGTKNPMPSCSASLSESLRHPRGDLRSSER